MKEDFDILKQFSKKLDKVFLFCPRNQELKDYKEEVLGTMMDKYNDLLSGGMDKDVAFDICVKSIDQFYDKDVVKELEEIKGDKKRVKLSKETVKLAIWGILTAIFFVLVVFVGIGVSPAGWRIAGITLGGMLAVPIVLGIVVSIIKTSVHNAYTINRFTIWLTGMGLTTLVFLIVSFSLNSTGNFNYVVDGEQSSVWALTWLSFIFGLVVCDVADLIYRLKEGKRIYSSFDAFLLSILITLSIYLSSSMIMDIACGVSIWSKSWVAFFIGIFIYFLMMFVRQILKVKKNLK